MSAAACCCPIRWPRLFAVIEGARHTVEPAAVDTPTSALFRAWCAGCGAEYPYPFRVAAARNRAA